MAFIKVTTLSLLIPTYTRFVNHPANLIISSQWPSLLLTLAALLLSLTLLTQIIIRYTSAYLAAPTEVTSYLDAIDSCISEHQSYDAFIARLHQLEDKARLDRMLSEIHISASDLHKYANTLLTTGNNNNVQLRPAARLLWPWKRYELAVRQRQLDLVRMRFLLAYIGTVASAPPSPMEPLFGPILAATTPNFSTFTPHMSPETTPLPDLHVLEQPRTPKQRPTCAFPPPLKTAMSYAALHPLPTPPLSPRDGASTCTRRQGCRRVGAGQLAYADAQKTYVGRSADAAAAMGD